VFDSERMCMAVIAPVDADGGEVEDGRRAAHDVTRHPRVTHYVTERPRAVVDLEQRQTTTSSPFGSSSKPPVAFSETSCLATPFVVIPIIITKDWQAT